VAGAVKVSVAIGSPGVVAELSMNARILMLQPQRKVRQGGYMRYLTYI
jgi:hypothetical protein